MKIKPIKMGKRMIGDSFNCYIIAEIGSNFDGKFSKAKRLIKLAKESDADAVKFQTFVTEKILSKRGFEKKTTFQKRWKKSVWEMYKNAEFPLEWHKELNQYAKKIGIDFLSTPYFNEAVDEIVKLKLPAIKIGSGEITNIEFLKYVGKTKKPIFLATGASNMKEVEEAVKTIKSTGNKNIVLMQTITQYPSPIEDANLKVLETFKNKFRMNVGYSDHSPGDLVILSSVALGSCVIEKHFTDNTALKGPDHPHAMNPNSFKTMVEKIRYIEKALGDGIKKLESSENETVKIQRRGIWTTTKILKGTNFNSNNIKSLRPVLEIPASKYKNILGKVAKRNFVAFEPIYSSDF